MKFNGITVKIKRNRRRSFTLRLLPDGSLQVDVPAEMTLGEIHNELTRHTRWIESHRQKQAELQEKRKDLPPLLTDAELNNLADQALKVIPDRVRFYAPIIGVTYGRITIRNQKTRWGSCSSKGNLNFNCLLMLTPPEVIDAVVVHELCHRKYMNHSKDFYREVYKAFPEYDKWNRWLKKHGAEILYRMTGSLS